MIETGFLLLLFSAFYAFMLGVSLFIFKREIRYREIVSVSFLSLISFVALIIGFMSDDFTVLYIANHSNTTLPWFYKLTAIWGGHEGSMLLWYLIIAVWTTLFASFTNIHEKFCQYTLSSLMFIQSIFGFFIAFFSNPFVRQFYPQIKEGLDLNPLLQDWAFIIHPPLLYLGYVGMSVPFSMTLALSLTKIPVQDGIRQILRWSYLPVAFLTFGIMLGSWWAYYELGWGGWWFWDPVENAALVPWLTGVALVHAGQGALKSNKFYRLTLWLALLGFVFAILGTFLVRSGVVSSVHSFASDPTRGVVLLIIFGMMLTVSFLAMRRFVSETELTQPSIKLPIFSQLFTLQINSLIFFLSALIVLFGTLYPIVSDTLFEQTLSVGAPYFNQTVVPLFILSILALLSYPFLTDLKKRPRAIILAVLLIVLVAAAFSFVLPYAEVMIVAAGMLGIYSTVKVIHTNHSQLFKKLPSLIAHVGVMVLFVGISLNSLKSIDSNVSLNRNTLINVGSWSFYLHDERVIEDLHSTRYIADIMVQSADRGGFILSPEKQYFKAREITMTETAISPGFFGDIYIALGDRRPDGSWACRIYLKPFVRWIWMGCILMAIGLLLGFFVRKKHDE